ncbi:MAG: DNA methyltransferase [Promethearchaeota archaeon]
MRKKKLMQSDLDQFLNKKSIKKDNTQSVLDKKIFTHKPEWILNIYREKNKIINSFIDSNTIQEKKINKIFDLPIEDITRPLSKFIGKKLIYMTHGLHIYPAKFIPQIPQLCIKKYSDPLEYIIDPFCGSGTTLVEAMLLRRNAYGIDINPLAQLVSRVKTTPLDLDDLKYHYLKIIEFLDMGIKNKLTPLESVPDNSDFPNLEYWFSERVRMELKQIQNQINLIENDQIKDFFLLILSSIIRKVSLADNDQLHPAKTKYATIQKGHKIPTFEIFKSMLIKKYKIMKYFSSYDFSDIKCKITGKGANDIELTSSIDLAVTSPPYVNALDYVRIHKLEAFWVGFLKEKEILPLRQKFIGTENIYVDEYKELPHSSNNCLNDILIKIHKADRKRAGIIFKYFKGMKRNIKEVYRILKKKGKYCIVIGANWINNILVPTPKILINLAESELGFKNIKNYVYEIINRRLKIPRADHGGTIRKEWIIVLEK